jgi:hypothetical protein
MRIFRHADSPSVPRAADAAHVGSAVALTQLGSPAIDLASGIQVSGAATPGAWNTQSAEITATHAFDDPDTAAMAGFGPDQY